MSTADLLATALGWLFLTVMAYALSRTAQAEELFNIEDEGNQNETP